MFSFGMARYRHSRLADVAGQFVQTIEHRQGLKVACLEEIGFRNGWLSAERLRAQADALGATGYGQYLHRVLESEAAR